MFVKLAHCWRRICVQFVLMYSVSVVNLTLTEDYGEENRYFSIACLGLLRFLNCQMTLFLR